MFQTCRQQQQHYKIVLENLQKRLAGQVTKFKSSLKIHGDNVKARTERVTSKYGHGNEQLRAGSARLAAGSSQYAMFSLDSDADGAGSAVPPRATTNYRSISNGIDEKTASLSGSVGARTGSFSTELRRRNLEHSSPYSSTGDNGGKSKFNANSGAAMVSGGLVQDLLHHQSSERGDARLSSAKKVEASIAQVNKQEYIVSCTFYCASKSSRILFVYLCLFCVFCLLLVASLDGTTF